jgi:hypothetical protein
MAEWGIWRSVCAVVAVLALPACDIVKQLPVITADVPQFSTGGPAMALTASITQDNGPIDDALVVRCTVSRRLTPTRSGPVITLPAQRGPGNRWRCPLTRPVEQQLRRSHQIDYQWLVFSRDGAGQLLKVAETELQTELLDCRTDPQAALLPVMANMLTRFPGDVTVQQIVAAGFLPSHGFASLRGLGVAFVKASDGASAIDLADAAPVNINEPNLLLFRANPAANTATISDPLLPDEPYRLIGFAYAQAISGRSALPLPPDGRPLTDRPQQPRPAVACIPHHEWMIHAAGFHMPDGSFRTGQPPQSPLPGVIPELPKAVLGLRHNALWDLHVFIGTGRPVIAITDTRRVDGNRVPFPGGLPSPADAFFYPTAYD